MCAVGSLILSFFFFFFLGKLPRSIFIFISRGFLNTTYH